MNDDATRHLETETMAAFVEGTLAPPELATATQHLAGCRECRTFISETALFEREEAEQSRVRPATAKWWWVAAALLSAAVLSVLLIRRTTRETDLVAVLIDAAPPAHRTVEPRLTGFPWAPMQAPVRGGAPPDPANLKLAGAAGAVLEKTTGQSAPESRRANGIANILVGRSGDAIASLEQAAKGSSQAAVWNDLAAARYVAAVADERLAQLPLALAAADRALQLEPKSAEALFNRALILERLQLREQAAKAWRVYLDADSGSEWAVEAREHLRKLADPPGRTDFRDALQRTAGDERAVAGLVRSFPRDARAWAEGPLLAEWADAQMAGDDARAQERLALARSLASALAKASGEQLAADAVAAIDRSSGEQRSALAAAHRLFRQARIDYQARRAAHQSFRGAEALFRRGDSPMADLAAYYAASALVDENQSGAAHDLLRALARRLGGRYRALGAQIRWELAMCASIAGDWGSALREATAAAETFTSLGEWSNTASVDGIAAYALERMGAFDLAWGRRIGAIAALPGDTHRTRRGAILHAGALGLEARDHVAAAQSVLDLVVDEGDAGNLPLMTVALLERGRLAARSGDPAAARRSLDEARRMAAWIEDPGRRELSVARIHLGDAVLLRASDPRASLPVFDRAIRYFGEHQSDALLADAYLQRARAHRATGDDAAAVADFAAALSQIAQQRRSARDSDVRMAFLDTAEEIAEESVQLHLSRGHVLEALDIVERFNALLREDAAAISMRPAMPPGVVAVRYVLLPEELAIFCVSSDGVVAKTLRVNRDQLIERMEQFSEQVRLRAPLSAIRANGGALYTTLVAPLDAALSGIEEIVVIPDRQLHAVPFAALYDQRQRRYLIERYTIRMATSVAGAGAIAASALMPASIIADPTTPYAPRLPKSREEAEQIGAMYRGTVIAGGEATVPRFEEVVKSSAMIHYAGHADSDFRESYGALLLAPSAGDRGILGSSEIARLALSQRPLVVLAACGTARGQIVHIAGMPSIARAFLDAGARAVVGTLWEIGDDVSPLFFTRFHQRLSQGFPPERALREVQAGMLASADSRLAHPAAWSAVQVISHSQ